MKLTINGEKPFSILANTFAIYSPEAFTLEFSVDGVHFSAWSEETPAGSNIMVNGVAEEIYFRLSGVSDSNVAIIKY